MIEYLIAGVEVLVLAMGFAVPVGALVLIAKEMKKIREILEIAAIRSEAGFPE